MLDFEWALTSHTLRSVCTMGARRNYFQGRANVEARPEGPRRGGVLREGAESPSPPELGSLGERCKLPSGVGCGAPAQIDFCTLFDL